MGFAQYTVGCAHPQLQERWTTEGTRAEAVWIEDPELAYADHGVLVLNPCVTLYGWLRLTISMASGGTT